MRLDESFMNYLCDQISEAFRRYGVSDDSKALFVVRIDAEIPQVQNKMKAVVNGNISSFSTLSLITDWAAVKKVRLDIHFASLH